MSTFKLNENQERFVHATDSNVLVSASAGSGKTSTMIEKLKKLILVNNVPVDKLLVVTFTELAAQEMKQKLYKGLMKDIKELNVSEEERANKFEEFFKISTSDIGTLHSICKKIITKYFYEVNIEPSFSMLSNEERNVLLYQAIDEVVLNYVESNDQDFFDLYELFSDGRNFEKLKNAVIMLFDYLNEKTDPKLWFNEVLNTTLNTNLKTNICVKFLTDKYKNELSECLKDLKLFEHSNCAKLSDMANKMIIEANNVINATCYTDFYNAITNAKLPSKSGKVDPEFAQTQEELFAVKDVFAAIVKEAKEVLVNTDESQFELSTNALKKSYTKLMEVVDCLKLKFAEIKLDVGKLDFSDLQIYAYKILCNEQIRKEICESYDFVFVDEYQDINQIQEEILLKISNGKNLNMIGDVKQSIYAFRQCMPDIFLNKYNAMINSKNKNLIVLNNNYRCSSAVVEFANYCFDALITNATIGINYKNDARLICSSKNSGNVKISLVNVVKSEEENDEAEEIKKDEIEAQNVLKIISDTLGKEYIDDKDLSVTKQITYKDIAIICRDTKGFANAVYKVLKEHKVPLSIKFKNKIFKTPELKFLTSLIGLMQNQNNDIYVSTVLLSSVVGLTESDLISIKNTYPDVEFYAAVQMAKNNQDKAVFDKLTKYYAILDNCRFKLNYMPISQIVKEFVFEHNLINKSLSFLGGEQVVKNIEMFIALIENPAYNFNVFKCLEFLKSIENREFEVSIDDGENSVKLLTMHKSKGLEFPVVILANLNKNFSKESVKQDLILTNDFGVGLAFRDAGARQEFLTLQKNASKVAIKHQEIEEQIRLFYVAQTRARNYLFLSGVVSLDKVDNKIVKPIKSSNSFFELLLKCFNNNNKFGFINKQKNFEILLNNGASCKAEILEVQDVLSGVKFNNNQVVLSGQSADVVSVLKQNFLKLAKSNQKFLATKTSVSAILGASDYVNSNELSVEIGFVEDSKNLSLELGNAYHKIMQNLNYTESDLEVENLVNKLILDKDILALIDPSKIVRAIEKIKPLILSNTKILKEQQFLLNTNYNALSQNVASQNVLVQGVIDLILINNGVAHIIDFKSNKTTDLNKLISTYSLQLNVYKTAVEKALNVKCNSAQLYLLESGVFVDIM